ncbi:MAG: hypothetical protein Q8N04_19610 [Nitrospira sp.]|nr:hypothetical protein [Nitrospira sp.]
MSIALISTILFSATLMNVNAEDLPYYDPPSPWIPSYSYAFKGASSILREQGEKLLLMNAETPVYRADHVIALMSMDYDSVREELRKLVLTRWGILEEHDSEKSPIPEPPADFDRGYTGWWPMLGKGLGYVADRSSHLQAREYQLVSQPYNLVPSINGHSQSLIRVSDGTGLLGTDVTILQLMRSDRSREWARSSFHGVIPLPYKEERRSVGVVTSTEIAFVESLKERFPRIAIRYFVKNGLQYDPDQGKLFRLQLEDAIHQIKE